MKFQGRVVKGFGIASKIFGFPTANLDILPMPMISPGIYAAEVIFKSKNYQAAVYVSPAVERRPEVHIFDFEQNIYGESIQVTLLQKVSEHAAWAGEERMKLKVASDIQKAKDFFG